MQPDKNKQPSTEDDPIKTYNPQDRNFQEVNDNSAADEIDELKGSVGDDEELFEDDDVAGDFDNNKEDEQDETKDITV